MDHQRSRPLALLASLPPGDAAALLQRLTANQIKLLAGRVTDRLEIDHSLPAQLTDELNQIPQQDSAFEAIFTTKEVRELMTEADAKELAELLAPELPQTVAAVLHQLPAGHAAAVLSRLSTTLQLSVAQRVANGNSAAPDVLHEVCSVVANQILGKGTRPLASRSGPIMIAQMLERMDDATERALVENLSQQDPILLERINDAQRLLRACYEARFVERRDSSEQAA